MKRNAQTQAPVARTVQDVSPELLRIEQGISEGMLDAPAALQAICAGFASLPAVSGAIIVLSEGRQLRCIVSAGAAPAAGAFLGSDNLIGECLQTSRLVRCQHASDDPRIDPVLRCQFGFESLLAVPVKARGSASGVLAVFSAQADGLDQDYVFAMGSAANLAAMIVPQLPVPEEEEAASPAEDVPVAFSRKEVQPELVDAPPAIGPGSTIDLTALSLSELLAPVAASEEEPEEAPAKAAPRAALLPQMLRPTATLRKVSMVGVGLLIFSTALFPAIRGRQNQVTPKPVASAAPAMKGSTEETIGSPTSVVAARVPARIVGGELRTRTAPVYPQNALRSGTQGEVKIVATVDEGGIVADTRVLSGSPELANAAVNAISHWRFAPFLAEGHPISVTLPVVVAFHCSGNEDSTQAALPPKAARQMR